jgi:hypothetical protein
MEVQLYVRIMQLVNQGCTRYDIQPEMIQWSVIPMDIRNVQSDQFLKGYRVLLAQSSIAQFWLSLVHELY